MNNTRIPNYNILQTASEEDAAFILNGLITYNTHKVPLIRDLPYEPCNLVAKDSADVIIGGCVGRIYLSALFIEFLWVENAHRKHGLGTQLLDRAEHLAKEKSCSIIHLDTFSFQAPDFYKKNGFEVFGILDGYPDGICRYYLKKTLV
jgi:ribosomal protein S18 acetylase RimI-like enzyme